MNTLIRHAARIVCALAIATLSTHAAMASRRVALVIGNAKYEHADTLTNTINDANAIAALLNKAGFDVVDVQRNVGVVEFKRAVREFVASAANADIAVVYYSGHGIEVGGTNYLIPVDAKLASDYDIEDEAIALDRVILATQSAKRLSLIILDACRDNPFLRTAEHATTTRSVANRLVGVQPTGADTLIAYAAKAGSVSYDGVGGNSPFTTALVKYIAEPGLDIRIALGKVRDDVLASTGRRQEPFVYGSLGGADISLVPPVAAPAVAKSESAPAVVDANAAAAHDYEMAERVGARQGWEAFLTLHATGFYADLARAQLAKLTNIEQPKIADATKDAKEQSERLAATRRQDDERRAQEEANRLKAQREAALQPRADVAPAPKPSADVAPAPKPPVEVAPAPKPLTSEQACKRDAALLARLRSDPTPEQVVQFARGLACEDLRPQVQRLAESLGVDAGALAQPATVSASLSKGVPQPKSVAPPPVETAASAATSGAPEADVAKACKRDSDELVRIRANPTRDAALRFSRDLKCEDLRAQASRLLESVGN